MKFKVLWIAGLMLAATAGQVQAAFVMTFDEAPQNWNSAYDTAGVDVDFVSGVAQWGSGYNDLTNVAYGGFGQPLIIDFISKNSAQVTLTSFDLGNWLGAGAVTQYDVFDLSNLTTPLVSVDNLTVTYSTTSHPIFGVNLLSTNGFRLVLGPDAFNIGIDNIVYHDNASAVPEPASLAMWSLGGLGMMIARRKRQKKNLTA